MSMSVETEIHTPASTTAGHPSVSSHEQFPVSNLSNIYERRTLVLIGCGAEKRDPEDPVDVRAASIGPDESFGPPWTDETGPAWRAEDLYTSTYFQLKRQFAKRVAGCEGGQSDVSPWAILSAEHHVLMPWMDIKPYDTAISDLGADELNPEHRVQNPFGLRRPDGREIVTEIDQWATLVAFGLMKWVAAFRDDRAPPGTSNANTLLVLAGQDYTRPLRERGVFEYGIARMTGDPNRGPTFPLRPRFLFEEIDASGIGEQMAWLSNAVDHLDEPASPSEQASVEMDWRRRENENGGGS